MDDDEDVKDKEGDEDGVIDEDDEKNEKVRMSSMTRLTMIMRMI